MLICYDNESRPICETDCADGQRRAVNSRLQRLPSASRTDNQSLEPTEPLRSCYPISLRSSSIPLYGGSARRYPLSHGPFLSTRTSIFSTYGRTGEELLPYSSSPSLARSLPLTSTTSPAVIPFAALGSRR